ncbi:MAG: tRNA pseudouridine(38-40) synthase TruA, partial [Methylocystis sp.]
MPRFALTIEYDGAPYVGWQRQANGVSVQQRLEEAVAAINGGVRAVVHGAGRTDAGVHALGQIAHIDLARDWGVDRLRDAINAHLKPD